MRKPGWYHVKDDNGFWQCAQWNGHGWHGIYAVEAKDGAWLEIGPRIPTPDEMGGWQLVPVQPTEKMTRALSVSSGTDAPAKDPIGFWLRAYKRMLEAAPKPETQP